MVLVFGIDVPLFEFMLVFMVLLTAGLIFVLLELKRLNQFLVIERADLRRLERDIGLLEQEEKKLHADEVALGIVSAAAVKKRRGRPKKNAAAKKAPAKKKTARKKLSRAARR